MKKLAFLSALLFGICLFTTFGYAQPAQPVFVTTDMSDAKVDTRALKGKVVVLNLWFINCPNCIEEIKLLNAVVDQYKDNANVVFLAPAASKKADLTKFLAKNPFKYRVLPDSAIIIISQFGTPDKNGDINIPFPMHYVLDREGKIVFKGQGIKSIEGMKSTLAAQLAKK